MEIEIPDTHATSLIVRRKEANPLLKPLQDAKTCLIEAQEKAKKETNMFAKAVILSAAITQTLNYHITAAEEAMKKDGV